MNPFDLLVQVAALTLLAGTAFYFLLLSVSCARQTFLTQRSLDAEKEYFRLKIEEIMALRKLEKEEHELSWNGFRKFTIAKKVNEGGDICSFYLKPHDCKPLPPFRPGQYLTFQLPIPDALREVKGDGKPVIRCYSLSDSPGHPDHYRVSIKRVPAPRDKNVPPGLVSGYFHDHLKEGDIVDIKAPAGNFVLDMTKQTPVVLIGGGIGLTPVLSMLNALVESGSKREAWFFYGVRNRNEQIMKESLQKLALENPHVHVQICYSDPSDQDVKGKDYDQAERVSVELFKKLLPSSNYEFYICGPPPMMNQLTQDLIQWGVPEKKIFFEAFGPATVKKLTPPDASSAPTAETAAPAQVCFAKSGKTLSWKSGLTSLLDLALENNVNISFGCRAGNCGTCLTAIKTGEVTYLLEPGAKPEAGSCLTCVSIPKGNLTLDA